MPIKHKTKLLATALARCIWPLAAITLLAAAGHQALRHQTPRPPPATQSTGVMWIL
jgi:hypothetical protein